MKGLVTENGKMVMIDSLEIPEAGRDETLVAIVATTMNPGDPVFSSGAYDSMLTQTAKEMPVKSGFEFAGVVLKESAQFKKGDRVLSYVDILGGQKSHQEVVAVNNDVLALMPPALDFNEVASVPCGAMVSLGALRDVGEVLPGERVLITGAAGGLGVYAVQIAAKIFNCRVTALAGSGQDEYLKSLGAENVIDYHQINLESISGSYDVILDLTSKVHYADIKHLLSSNGRFIPADPDLNGPDFAEGSEAARRTRYLLVSKGNKDDLNLIADWLTQGQLVPAVDSVFDFDCFDKAIERLGVSGKRGRVVLHLGPPK